LRVVVVEDDRDLLDLATAVLRKAGHSVIGVTDGDTAVDIVIGENPELVCLDLMLPGRDGFEVLEALREHGFSDRVPVVIISALVGSDDRRRALEAGAVDFLPKPYTPQQLVELAQSLQSATQQQLTQHRAATLEALAQQAQSLPADERTATPASRAHSIDQDFRHVLAGVLDLSVDAIVSVDAHQLVIGFNRGAEQMFGFTTDEVLGQPLDALLPGHLVEAHREHLRRFGRGSETSRHMGERREIHGRRKDGSLFPAEASILKNVVGGRLTFTAILRDISERERFIEELQSRARQQAAVAALGQRALSSTDADAFLRECTKAVADTLRVDLVEVTKLRRGALVVCSTHGWRENVLGREMGLDQQSHAGYVVAVDHAVVVADLRAETRFRPPSLVTSEGGISGAGVPIPGQAQHFGALTVYTRVPRTFSDDDVHFLQAVANVIAGLVERGRVESQLRTFLDAAPDATVVVDNGGRVVSANPQAAELTGYAADDLVGMTVEQLVPQRFRAAHAAHRSAYGDGPRLRPMGAGRELSVLKADGTEVPVDIMLNPLETDEGQLVVAAMRDVTDRRRVEAMREAFLRAVSHDLRTPLASLVGFAEILAEEENLPEHHRHYVDRIIGNAHRLERLLRDLLDLDRLNRGVLRPNRRPTDIRQLVDTVVAALGMKDEHPVEVAVGHDISVASVDPAQVERILENLLINVGRHTPPGTACRIDVERNHAGILLTVEDEGPGVPGEIKDIIFDAFQRGEGRAHSPGTGIGLSLVAHFAELHDGRAWVEDVPSGGARFRVVLTDG
jgi:PAS domain S-box-containing protein